MWDIDTNLYEAWDELDRLYEAADESASAMSYDEIDAVLTGNNSSDSERKKLKRLSRAVCKLPSMRGAREQNWPYQLQLMYNSYKLECHACEMLNDMSADDLNRINVWLSEKGLVLPAAHWEYNATNHDVLEPGEQPRVRSDTAIDLIADPYISQEPTTDLKVVNAIEVKGTTGSPTNARSFHGADLAIIYVFKGPSKKSATPYLSIIEDGNVSKSLALSNGQMEVNGVDIRVKPAAIPSVSQLVVNNKPLEPNAIKNTPELTSDITDQVSL